MLVIRSEIGAVFHDAAVNRAMSATWDVSTSLLPADKERQAAEKNNA